MSVHKDILAKLGITVDDSHLSKAAEFRSWWDCTASSFFEREVTIKKETGEVRQRSLAMADGVSVHRIKKKSYKIHIKACRHWASLLFNEHTDLEIKSHDDTDEARGAKYAEELAFLSAYYENEDAALWPEIERRMPEVFGMGALAVVTEYSAAHGIMHKWHSLENILPVECRQGRVRSVVFVSSFRRGSDEYTLYNLHREIPGRAREARGGQGVLAYPSGVKGYEIENIIIKKRTSERESAEAFGLREKYTSDVRMFAVFRPFGRSIGGYNDAFGLPVYFDAVDAVAEIDDLYNDKCVDTLRSQRHIFWSKDLMNFDSSGNAIMPERLVGTVVATAALEQAGGELKTEGVKEFAPELRTAAYSAELQEAKSRFFDDVGLGADFGLKAGGKGIATATQIVSEDQSKFINLKKHVSANAGEFMAFNRAILAASNENEGKSFDTSAPIGYHIQDSVVVDDETRRKDALAEFEKGAMSLERYLTEHSGLTGNALEEELARIQDAGAAEMDAAMARVYGDVKADNAPGQPGQKEPGNEKPFGKGEKSKEEGGAA